MLKSRKLDRHKNGGLNFTELGFGTAPLGNLYKSISDEEAQETLDEAWASGLRYFDKAAVEIGGGNKHRMTLDDMIMFKDNHIATEKSIFELIAKAKKTRKKIEIEVENNADAILAATLGVDIIMLDNFTPKQINNTIKNLQKLNLRKNVKLEASGQINEKNISQYAKTGVDMISVGEITNSVHSIDLSLELTNR